MNSSTANFLFSPKWRFLLAGGLCLLTVLLILWFQSGRQADSVRKIPGFQNLQVNWRGQVWAAEFSGANDETVTRLQQLAGTSLQALQLTDSTLTDAGIQQLARFVQLYELNLQGSSLDAESLSALGELPRLRKLNLTDCHLPFPVIEKLQQQLPATRIWN